MKPVNSIMMLTIAAALATSAGAATPPPSTSHAAATRPAKTEQTPMTEADVRTLLAANGYRDVDKVAFADNTWTAKGTTAVGNTFDLRIDPLTRAITVNYDGDHNNAEAPANGLSKEAITAKLQAAGYTQIENVQFDNGVWTAQAWDFDNTAVQLKLDPIDGHIIKGE